MQTFQEFTCLDFPDDTVYKETLKIWAVKTTNFLVLCVFIFIAYIIQNNTNKLIIHYINIIYILHIIGGLIAFDDR